MAVAALVLGIVSLVFTIIPGLQFIGAIVGLIGIILGVLGRKKAKADNQPTGTATAGFVMSIIGTVLSAIMYIACVIMVTQGAKALEKELGDPKFQEKLKQELEKGMKEADK